MVRTTRKAEARSEACPPSSRLSLPAHALAARLAHAGRSKNIHGGTRRTGDRIQTRSTVTHCSVAECDRDGPYRKGLCDPHYWKTRRYGDPTHDPRPPVPPAGQKRCPRCREVKEVSGFHRDSATKSGYKSACKKCCNAKDRGRKRVRGTASRRRTLLNRYGLTLAEYDTLLAKQGGVCGVCGQPESDVDRRSGLTRSLAVDHCHESGKVRGLLCRKCNHGLGLLGDQADDVRRLLAYLLAADTNDYIKQEGR